MKKIFDSHPLQLAFSVLFLSFSTLLRIILTIWISQDFSFSFFNFSGTFLVGFLYDLGIISFFWVAIGLYKMLLPLKLVNSWFDKILTYFFVHFYLLILVFVFFAEITFWEEFKSRFNFVAVDYLIYTYEVVNNINQSYPLIILIPSVFLITAFLSFLFKKKGVYKNYFQAVSSKGAYIKPLLVSMVVFFLFLLSFKISNNEWSDNRYNNEISKAGIHSFFLALKTESLSYNQHYKNLSDIEAFQIVREKLRNKQTILTFDSLSIKRQINSSAITEKQPNIILIMMESMSTSFMKAHGNEQNITPTLDSLSTQSIYFNNMFATGTRTVRGMEAVMMSITPTAGSSIVKRPNNSNLFTIGKVFQDKNYVCNFFYGGDGYFDNMNAFFGGSGFNIYDRNHGSILNETFKTNHEIIEDDEVTFENAWGICDGDIYNKMLKVADIENAKGKPFFNFIMTTSNHRPYTYPDKIDIPSGQGRDGAVKYSDFAVGNFLREAQKKAWYQNTIFVIVADHCASSAGKDEIDVKNYKIPAFIFGASVSPQKIDKLVSQIDLMPSLFGWLDWSYQSNFFGQEVFSAQYEERAFVGTYLKLGYLKNDQLFILSNNKKINSYHWNPTDHALKPAETSISLQNEAISYYQSASYLFENKKLKVENE